jgi:hypothetical protein
MNDTRSMNRARRFSARVAVVLCLLLAVGMVPMAAFAAPTSASDVSATYLNSATITLSATDASATFCQLDSGAVTATTSVTTSVYGAHILKFWSTDGSGNKESTITAPFFIDEDVLPTLVTDCKASYVTTAAIELTATDNFNGSGVDFLCYRIDGGKIITTLAPAQVAATKLLLAQLATVKVPTIKMSTIKTAVTAASPPAITATTTPPANHYGTVCSNCHVIISSEPTATPGATDTAAPLSCSVVVTGNGSHKIEYWAQDVARNATAHAVRTFSIVPATTACSLKTSTTSTHVNRTVTLSGKVTGGLPAKTHVRFEMKRPGSSKWWTITGTASVSSAGTVSIKYKVTRKGTYYFRLRYVGSTNFKASLSKSVKVVVKK